MDNVNIRKLVESDYDQVIEIYTQLDEFHVQARPDCFVHREKDKIYPKDAFIHNLSYPGGLELLNWAQQRLPTTASLRIQHRSSSPCPAALPTPIPRKRS